MLNDANLKSITICNNKINFLEHKKDYTGYIFVGLAILLIGCITFAFVKDNSNSIKNATTDSTTVYKEMNIIANNSDKSNKSKTYSIKHNSQKHRVNSRPQIINNNSPSLLNEENKIAQTHKPFEDENRSSKVEKEAKFPGGAYGWKRYLERNLDANVAANDGCAPGNYTVKVEFIVDEEGNVSNAQAVEVPEACPSCGTEAVKVIEKGP